MLLGIAAVSGLLVSSSTAANAQLVKGSWSASGFVGCRGRGLASAVRRCGMRVAPLSIKTGRCPPGAPLRCRFRSLHHRACHRRASSFDRTAAAARAQLPDTQPMDSGAPQSPDLSSYHCADTEPVHPQHQGYRGSVSHAGPQHVTDPALSSPSLQTTSVPPYPSYPVAPGARTEESMQDADYTPDASLAMPPMPGMGNGSAGSSMLPPNADSIIIKNHFPVARIKRIMQADDDVGKVAQVTPVVVCK